MRTTIARFSLTLAVVGIATFGGVAVAPGASAAPADTKFVFDLDGKRVKAPTVRECDPENEHKQHNICVVDGSDNRF